MFCIALATKMAITALFVSVATIIAERLGAAVGALVATLPVSAGPVYVFLALDHDATFAQAQRMIKRCRKWSPQLRRSANPRSSKCRSAARYRASPSSICK